MCSDSVNSAKALQCRPLVSDNISYTVSIAYCFKKSEKLILDPD